MSAKLKGFVARGKCARSAQEGLAALFQRPPLNAQAQIRSEGAAIIWRLAFRV